MKHLMAIFVFVSLLGATVSVHALGMHFPRQDRPVENSGYPSGHVFKFSKGVTGNVLRSYDYDDVAATADYMCYSGQAKRISGWRVGPLHVAHFPGSCRWNDRNEYCTGGYDVYNREVGATFRCL